VCVTTNSVLDLKTNPVLLHLRFEDAAEVLQKLHRLVPVLHLQLQLPRLNESYVHHRRVQKLQLHGGAVYNVHEIKTLVQVFLGYVDEGVRTQRALGHIKLLPPTHDAIAGFRLDIVGVACF